MEREIEQHYSGSLQIKNGVYYTVIGVVSNGKRKNIWKTTKLPVKGNKKIAGEILRNRIAEMEAGDFTNEKKKKVTNPLFSDYLEQWIKQNEHLVAYRTTQTRKTLFKARIKSYFDDENIHLQDLTPDDVEDFYQTMYSENLSGSTMIHYHQLLNQSLKDAVKKDILDKNPMEKVNRPKLNKPMHDFLTGEEMQKLLEVAKNDQLIYPIVFLTAHYGFRRSEVLGLRWDAIDFNQNTISVKTKVYDDHESGNKDGLVITNQLKTEASYRTLPLLPAVREVLFDVKKQTELFKSYFGKCYSKDYEDMVFVDPMGILIKPGRVTERFAKLQTKNGLKKIRFHDLRHSCASLLVAGGIDMKYIQHWLGHANYSTTADIYSHLRKDAHNISAKAIEEALDEHL